MVERSYAGLDRARAQGKHLGRPFSTTPKQRAAIKAAIAAE
jgi:putative DNA-invertase from lambdoid prophage Rac